MCFGPEASFGSSIFLALVGVACLKEVKHKEEVPLASFPLLFAVQQFDEGLLWLALNNGGPPDLVHRLSLIFLFVALCLWPIMAPGSLYFLEPGKKQKKLMALIVAIGAGFALYAGYHLAVGSCSASIARLSIKYKRDIPGSNAIMAIAYLTAIFGAWFMSSRSAIRRMAALSFILGCIAQYFNHRAFISVWCFFAAIWSSLIYLTLRYFHDALPMFPHKSLEEAGASIPGSLAAEAVNTENRPAEARTRQLE